jgi:hypothetical protein
VTLCDSKGKNVAALVCDEQEHHQRSANKRKRMTYLVQVILLAMLWFDYTPTVTAALPFVVIAVYVALATAVWRFRSRRPRRLTLMMLWLFFSMGVSFFAAWAKETLPFNTLDQSLFWPDLDHVGAYVYSDWFRHNNIVVKIRRGWFPILKTIADCPRGYEPFSVSRQGDNLVLQCADEERCIPLQLASVAHYQQSCMTNDVSACLILVGFYSGKGEGGLWPDEKKANLWRQKACDLGQASACRVLAFYADYGIGADRDAERAVKLYRKACNAGSRLACRQLCGRDLTEQAASVQAINGGSPTLLRIREQECGVCDNGPCP